MERIRIFLVDDHPTVLDQIEARLSDERDFEIVGKATDSKKAVTYALSCKPHILLIDPVTPDGLDLETIDRVKSLLPSVAVVVLTAFVDTSLQLDLRKVGVNQILEKGIASEQLIDVLREVV